MVFSVGIFSFYNDLVSNFPKQKAKSKNKEREYKQPSQQCIHKEDEMEKKIPSAAGHRWVFITRFVAWDFNFFFQISISHLTALIVILSTTAYK